MMGKKKASKYQIVVTGEQNTTALCALEPHVYEIQAEDPAVAQTRAVSLFSEKYPDAVNVTFIDEGKERRKNIVPIVCMAISCLISFIPWNYDVLSTFTIAPSTLSTLMAVIIYSAVILRIKGLANSFKNPSETILSCLTILFCASFLSFFCGDVDVKILFWDFTLPGKTILVVAIGASWLGMSAFAGFVWVVLFILAAVRIAAGDVAMGFWGSIYILSSFLGIVFQLKNETAAFRGSLHQDFLTGVARMHKQVVKDAGATSEAVKKTVADTASTIAKASSGVG